MSELKAGDRVWCRDAFGNDLPCIATSGVVSGRDFLVVWAHKEALGPEHAIPWPVEDVRTRAAAAAVPNETEQT